MESLADLLLESWDRQVRILSNLAAKVNDSNRHAKPSPDGWAIDFHLCHIHEVRYSWLTDVSPERSKTLGDVLLEKEGEWVPIDDLEEIKRQLQISAQAVRDAVAEGLNTGLTKVGPYSSPVFFLQHMVWHEGYHFSLLLLALRNIGQEPDEEWEEANVWGIWRS